MKRLSKTYKPNKPISDEGLIVVNKPAGITSHDIIDIVRFYSGVKKVGHAGTLDPLATGLMLVAIGREHTRKLQELLKLPKTYNATVLLGVSSETGDLEGVQPDQKVATAARLRLAAVTTPAVDQVLQTLHGQHDFKVPLYSAIKVDGKPLYWYARNNKPAPRIPVKTMTITNIARTSDIRPSAIFDGCVEFDLTVSVASGTYIRTIIEEIGRKLNVPATMSALHRTQVGDFTLDEAVKLEKIL